MADKRKIKLTVESISSNKVQQPGTWALVLAEDKGTRRLPIIIGPTEAMAINNVIDNIDVKRPMTHDLFTALAQVLGFYVVEIVISDLREGIFFATITGNDGEKDFSLDARPSDAVAIGLRFGASIYTYERIMSEASIDVGSEENEQFESPDEETIGKPASVSATEPAADTKKTSKDKTGDSLTGTSSERLNEMLDEALNNEDYERAAAIRDELNRRA